MRICKECGNECDVDKNGIVNHYFDEGKIDSDSDADHVAIPELIHTWYCGSLFHCAEVIFRECK